MGSDRLFIRGLATVSPLGASSEEVEQMVSRPVCRAVERRGGRGSPVFPLTPAGEELVDSVSREERFAKLDRVTCLALAAARQTLLLEAGNHLPLGIVSIGSSRGATETLERTILEAGASAARVPTHTSPSTTAGNISSWVAQEYLSQRPEGDEPLVALNTSMTCSSAFHSLLVALSFVKSGMARAALFGGAEACLTSYTLAQLDALRIYSSYGAGWPCRPGNAEPVNSVVLGEGAGTAILCAEPGPPSAPGLELLGVGWALEETPSATGVSADGEVFEAAMRRAVASLPPGVSVDCVVAHAPGTVLGDRAELSAIARVFGGISTVSTKHLTGHTYGASGMVSMSLAQSLLHGVAAGDVPYNCRFSNENTAPPTAVLINTAGFGGNCVSVVLGRAKRG